MTTSQTETQNNRTLAGTRDGNITGTGIQRSN